jgi:radical SAM superfamily enzyme YgiQ (UPF0313 family)
MLKNKNGRAVPLFVYPRTGSDAAGFNASLPLSTLLAASLIPDAVVADQRRMEDDALEALIASREWRYVGISAMTSPQIRHALDVSEMAHRHGCRTVWGGIHPTLIPEQTLEDPRVDAVVVGDGELGSLTALTQETGIIRAQTPDLSTVPTMCEILERWGQDLDYYLERRAAMFKSIDYLATRGCPFRCSYCSEPALHGRKIKQPPVDRAVADILELQRRYGIESLIFSDEEFLANRTGYPILQGLGGAVRVGFQVRMDLLDRYDLDELYRLGVRGVAPGLESGSVRLLREVLLKDEDPDLFLQVNRRLARSQIYTRYNFMVGLPTETHGDRIETVELALKLLEENPNMGLNTFYTFVPYPGTALWPTCLKLGFEAPKRLEEWAEFNRHHKKTPWAREIEQELRNLEISSKFVGRRFGEMFPDNEEVRELTRDYTERWRDRDITSDAYLALNDRAHAALRKIFGENYYY